MREIDPLVFEYQHEKRRPRESEALIALRKIASLVKPIMRRRDWKVGTLCEFYPRERNLLGLNINSGQKICLRLRYQTDERQFLPIEQVVDTMLHELCHNVHGPHNQQFHALWNQLRDEHEELICRGYTGEGFLSEGRRLGGQKIPLDEARRRARAAAEQRRSLSAGSGRKLGGTPILRGTDMRKIIANAAQRRVEVTQGCASGTRAGIELAEEASRNGFRTKAEEEDANEQAIMQAYIEMIEEEEREKYGTSYIPPSQENPAGPRTRLEDTDTEALSRPPLASSSLPSNTVKNAVNTVGAGADNDSYEVPWACPICTLENPPNFLCCDACAAERPAPAMTTMSPSLSPELEQQREQELEWKRYHERRQQQQKRELANQPKPNPTSLRTKRPAPPTSIPPIQRRRESSADGTFAFKNRTSALRSLSSLERDIQKRPLGWVCHGCGAFMETEWWTCSSCGMMKQVS